MLFITIYRTGHIRIWIYRRLFVCNPVKKEANIDLIPIFAAYYWVLCWDWNFIIIRSLKSTEMLMMLYMSWMVQSWLVRGLLWSMLRQAVVEEDATVVIDHMDTAAHETMTGEYPYKRYNHNRLWKYIVLIIFVCPSNLLPPASLVLGLVVLVWFLSRVNTRFLLLFDLSNTNETQVMKRDKLYCIRCLSAQMYL